MTNLIEAVNALTQTVINTLTAATTKTAGIVRLAAEDDIRTASHDCALTPAVMQNLNLKMPVGLILMSPVATPFYGTLRCDGTAYATADYPRLAALMSETVYQDPDPGSGYFRVPDLRGVFPRFLDDGANIDQDRLIGTRQEGTLALGEIGGHNLVWGLSVPNTDAAARANIGVDFVSNQRNVEGVYTSSIGNETLPSAPGSAVSGASRPVNMAVMALIVHD